MGKKIAMVVGGFIMGTLGLKAAINWCHERKERRLALEKVIEEVDNAPDVDIHELSDEVMKAMNEMDAEGD